MSQRRCPKCGYLLVRLRSKRIGYYWGHTMTFGEWGVLILPVCDYTESEAKPRCRGKKYRGFPIKPNDERQ